MQSTSSRSRGRPARTRSAFSTTAGRVNVTGLPARVSIGQAEDANDDLHVLGLSGADRITAGFGLRALLGLTFDGAPGATG